MVTQISGPFTLAAKDAAIQRAIRQNYEDYSAVAAGTRAWTAKNLPQRTVMKKSAHLAHMIDPKTKEILLGFLGVESFVDDYVWAGIQGAGNDICIREYTLLWGREEERHGNTFRYCLVDSGLMSAAEVDKYLAECSEDTWTFKRQTGFDATAILASGYGNVQERQTKSNYAVFIRHLIREYESAPEGERNQALLAIAEALRFVMRDEGAHEGNFRNLMRIYLRYRPDLALDAMRKAHAHYTMPNGKLPNRQEFEAAIISAKIITLMDFGREILKPTLQGVGLNSRSSVARAEEAVRDLPENAIIQIQGKPLTDVEPGAVVYEMSPQGIFSLAA